MATKLPRGDALACGGMDCAAAVALTETELWQVVVRRQHRRGVQVLRSLGLQPHMLACRSTDPLGDNVRDKLALFCQVPPDSVLGMHDVSNIWQVRSLPRCKHACLPCLQINGLLPHVCQNTIQLPQSVIFSHCKLQAHEKHAWSQVRQYYEGPGGGDMPAVQPRHGDVQVPVMMMRQKAHVTISNFLGLPGYNNIDMHRWQNHLANRWDAHTETVSIAIIGKYTDLADSYLSVIKSLQHACLAMRRQLKLSWVEAGDIEAEVRPHLCTAQWIRSSFIPSMYSCGLAVPRASAADHSRRVPSCGRRTPPARFSVLALTQLHITPAAPRRVSWRHVARRRLASSHAAASRVSPRPPVQGGLVPALICCASARIAAVVASARIAAVIARACITVVSTSGQPSAWKDRGRVRCQQQSVRKRVRGVVEMSRALVCWTREPDCVGRLLCSNPVG